MATANSTNGTLSYHKGSSNYYINVKTPTGRKRFYLGRDEDAALELYYTHRRDFEAGIDPRKTTVNGIQKRLECERACTLFLEAKIDSVSRSQFDLLRRTCQKIKDHFGATADISRVGPEQFLGLRRALDNGNPITLGNEIQRARQLWIWLDKYDHCPRPKFGDFIKPKKSKRREHLRNRGDMTFEAAELRAILAELAPMYRAAVLLSINCAMTQEDVLRLRKDEVKGDVIRDLRAKTKEERKAVLWSETLEAIAMMDADPESELVFAGLTHSTLTERFKEARKKAGVYREGKSYRELRHTFGTVARDLSGDDTSVRCVMGHVHPDVLSEHYTHRFSEDRIRRVADVMRNWLFERVTTPVTAE